MWKGPSWDVDAFWVRPVGTPTNAFNSPDQSQEFMGVYSIYKGFKKDKFDTYFLRYIETDGTGFEYNTVGVRYKGNHCGLLFDSEVAGQWGDVGANSQRAWAYTLGLGRKFECIPWSPTFWTYFDFATGDENGNGYHHQFPLAHKYMGFMDLFGRRNIQDLNFRLNAKPCDKLTLLAWYHIFKLQTIEDVPYSVVMTPFVATPGGSSDLGQEIDLMAKYSITPRSNLALGYPHFFSGAFYSTNPSPTPFSGDANFYWAQFTQNF